MEGLRNLLSRKSRFMPRTQSQALAALAEGIVDESVFVWKAVNVHPVFEEPWDINEIERLLAKEDLDLETTLLLMTIFERLIRDPDKEAALFAAESINAIEQRHARRILKFRKAAAAAAPGAGPGPLRSVAAAYRDFGLACFARPELRRFYLREALAVLDELRDLTSMPGIAAMAAEDEALCIDVLLELGDLAAADGRIEEAMANHPRDSRIALLAARARFERRDFRGVVRLLESAGGWDASPGLAAIRDFWTGGTCRE